MKFEFTEGRLKYTVYLDENKCSINVFKGDGGWDYSFPIGHLPYWIEIESKSKGASDKLIALLKNEDRRIKLNSILI